MNFHWLIVFLTMLWPHSHSKSTPPVADVPQIAQVVPGFMSEWGYVPVPDGTCDKSDDGYFFFLGPDGAITFSQKDCVDAVKQWMQSPVTPPKKLLLA